MSSTLVWNYSNYLVTSIVIQDLHVITDGIQHMEWWLRYNLSPSIPKRRYHLSLVFHHRHPMPWFESSNWARDYIEVIIPCAGYQYSNAWVGIYGNDCLLMSSTLWLFPCPRKHSRCSAGTKMFPVKHWKSNRQNMKMIFDSLSEELQGDCMRTWDLVEHGKNTGE